jgi:hypothetical protein
MEIQLEVQLLKQFAASSLKQGSVVSNKVKALVSALETELARQPKPVRVPDTSLRSSGNFQVTLLINLSGFKDPVPIDASASTTLLELKTKIEGITGPSLSTERIKVRRTGKAFGEFDSKSLMMCEIIAGDEIVVDCKNTLEMVNPVGLERIINSGLQPKSSLELLALALHAFMLDWKFVPIVELANSVPGFAPSVKGRFRFVAKSFFYFFIFYVDIFLIWH